MKLTFCDQVKAAIVIVFDDHIKGLKRSFRHHPHITYAPLFDPKNRCTQIAAPTVHQTHLKFPLIKNPKRSLYDITKTQETQM